MQAIEKQDVREVVVELEQKLDELFFNRLKAVEDVSEKLQQLSKEMGEAPAVDVINQYIKFHREIRMLAQFMLYNMEDYEREKFAILDLKEELFEQVRQTSGHKEKA